MLNIHQYKVLCAFHCLIRLSHESSRFSRVGTELVNLYFIELDLSLHSHRHYLF